MKKEHFEEFIDHTTHKIIDYLSSVDCFANDYDCSACYYEEVCSVLCHVRQMKYYFGCYEVKQDLQGYYAYLAEILLNI